MRDHRVASRPRPQGAARGVAAAGGSAASAAAAQVRPESRCGAGLLLGDVGYADGQAVGADAGELVAILRRFGELDVDDDTAALLVSMSAATIDRAWPATERKRHQLKGRSRTKPGHC